MSTYNKLKAEAEGSWTYSAALKTNQLTYRDLAGLGKMNFSTIEAGKNFSDQLAKYPNLDGFFKTVGNLAVPAGANPAAASRFDPVMSAFGAKFRNDPAVLKKLSDDFRENPKIGSQLIDAIKKNPQAAAQAIRVYNGAEAGPGKLETLVGRINQGLSPVATAAAPVAIAAAAPARDKPAARTSAPEQTSRAPKPERPAPEKIEPIVAAANQSVESATPAINTSVTPASSEVASSPTPKMTAEDIEKMADPLADKFQQIVPDINNLEEFRRTLKTDKAFQSRIAENFNNNPDFVEQMMKMAEPGKDGQKSATDKLLEQYGRPTIRDIVSNPSKLADDSYVDGLTDKLGSASGGLGGLMSKLGDMFGGINFGEIFAPLAEICQKAFAALKECFSGGNMLAMKNGVADLFGDAFGKDGALSGLTGQHGTDERPQYVEAANGNIVDPNAPQKPEQERQRQLAQAPQNQAAGAPQPAGGNPAPPTALASTPL